jgi:uncharacterized protein
MASGKPAGIRCIQLTDDNRCLLFGQSLRPAVCSSLQPNPEMCGTSCQEAMQNLAKWEAATAPDKQNH